MLSRASVLYAKGPRRLRRVAVRVLPASFKRRIHERLGPTPFSKAPHGFVPTWENPDISLYLDPDYMHRSYVQRPQELVLEYIRQATQHSIAPLSLLDAGCGNGRLYRALADGGLLQKLEYRGADVTRKVVEAARTLYPDGVFDEGSIEKLPYMDGSFDIVVTQHVIRYLEYYERALAECLRVSRWLFFVVEKEAVPENRLGSYYNETLGSFFNLNLYGSGKLKAFARAHGAALAFTLNDSHVDDPDGQVVYVFCKPAPWVAS